MSRDRVRENPRTVRAGVLFGLWVGLMCTLMGMMHLDHLVPHVLVQTVLGIVGLTGLVGVVPVAEAYRRRGGRWSPDAWLSGVLLMGAVLVVLLGVDFWIRPGS